MARRMHTLRSNAGFICALAIMHMAAALEKAIAQDELDAWTNSGGGHRRWRRPAVRSLGTLPAFSARVSGSMRRGRNFSMPAATVRPSAAVLCCTPCPTSMPAPAPRPICTKPISEAAAPAILG